MTRNRRYYLTLRGRLKKRAGQSRYFQAHRLELYEKRAARFARLLETEIERIRAEYATRRQSLMEDHSLPAKERRRSLAICDEMEAFDRSQAAASVRVNHNWHGGIYDGPVGRLIYAFDRNGKLLNAPSMGAT